MSYSLYKLIHLTGIFMVLVSLGGLTLYVANGGVRAENSWRRQAALTHGIGLFLALLGGFGMLARLGIHWPWPTWLIVKLVVWLLLGAMVALVYRKSELSKVWWWGTILLALFAGFMALVKPI